MVFIIKIIVKSIKCSCLICNKVIYQHNDTGLGLQNSKVNHNDLKVGIAKIKQSYQKNYILNYVSGYTKSEA